MRGIVTEPTSILTMFWNFLECYSCEDKFLANLQSQTGKSFTIEEYVSAAGEDGAELPLEKRYLDLIGIAFDWEASPEIFDYWAIRSSFWNTYYTENWRRLKQPDKFKSIW
jgi:hypothetical protein